MRKEIKQVNLFSIVFITGITILFFSSLYWNIHKEYLSAREFAKIEAQASYNKDLLYRRWATMQGGVYVPITNVTPPSPYLKFIPERDITTDSGKKLTLVNPAYMTRQVHEIAQEQYGVKGHITSLKPIRPENKADAWETKVLHKFETGVDEYNSIEQINDKKYMRLMHVMRVEQNCLKCHSSQGYKIGDIRGGISVSVPMEKYTDVAYSYVLTTTITYILIYLSIIIIFIIGYKKFMKGLNTRILMQDKILKDEEHLIQQNKEYAQLNEEYKTQNEELHIAKVQAEDTANLLGHITDNLPAYIAVVDVNTLQYKFVNTKFTIGFNKTKEEIVGFHISEIIGKENTEFAMTYINEVRQGKASSYINTFHLSEGTRFVNVNYVPEFNDKGEVKNIIVLSHDITALKQSEIALTKTTNELLKAKEKAEESDRLKTAFLANMSHEIRTPMNGILGFTELLKEPDLSGKDKLQYVDIIEKSGARLLNIINDIIDISKIESGLMKVTNSEININEQIEFIYTFFKPEVEKKGVGLSYNIGLSAENAFINTDSEKLYAILTNLVKNAIKYTNEGGIEFGYKISKSSNTIDTPSELLYFVKDSGIGIHKDRQDAIFERFIQADISDVMARQGAGLGLTITKAYIEMLGGKIWLESEAGKGSIFYFTIPYKKVQTNNESIEFAKEERPEFQIKKLNLLVAEDDEMSMRLIAIKLKDYCNAVLFANNGIEAIEMCRNNPNLDLVLMDMKMPKMNGYESTKQIRQFNKDIIIIAQTAYALSGDKEKALEAGCNEYISKPIIKDALLELIRIYFQID